MLHTCRYMRRPEEGVGSPETRGIGHWWVAWCGCWELNSDPLQEQDVLLTMEPPLQSQWKHSSPLPSDLSTVTVRNSYLRSQSCSPWLAGTWLTGHPSLPCPLPQPPRSLVTSSGLLISMISTFAEPMRVISQGIVFVRLAHVYYPEAVQFSSLIHRWFICSFICLVCRYAPQDKGSPFPPLDWVGVGVLSTNGHWTGVCACKAS